MQQLISAKRSNRVGGARPAQQSSYRRSTPKLPLALPRRFLWVISQDLERVDALTAQACRLHPQSSSLEKPNRGDSRPSKLGADADEGCTVGRRRRQTDIALAVEYGRRLPQPGAAPLGSGGKYSQQSPHRTSRPGESSRRTVTRWRFSTKPVCRLPTAHGEYSRPRHLGHAWMSFQMRVRKCGLLAPSHGARWQAFSITLW